MRRIAIVGATGLVGREIIRLCESYFDPDTEYILYASEKSQGSKIKVNNTELTVKLLSENNIEEVELDFVRSSGKRVPVFSAGAGARFNIMGFLVLEVYYAYPFQRPTKGPHWGFLLSPGW